jgi:hypothetical protein
MRVIAACADVAVGHAAMNAGSAHYLDAIWVGFLRRSDMGAGSNEGRHL